MSPDGAGGSPPPTSGSRTVLAWQRTAFALLAGAALLTRLTAGRLGAASLAAPVAAAPLAVWLLWVGAARARGRGSAAGSGAGPAAGAADGAADGRLPAAVCAVTVVVGLTELAALLLGGTS